MLRLSVVEKREYLAAEQRELASIERLNVIEGEVPIPPGKTLIGSLFVYPIEDTVAQDGLGADSEEDLPSVEI